MRRGIGIAVLLCLAVGLSTGGDESFSCRSIPLSDINWVASFDDDHPVTPENHASIVHDADESGEFYGIEWNSPEITDLSLIALDQLDRTGVTTINLALSASESMDVVVVVQVKGDYCNGSWRYASADAIQVGTETQKYELHVSDFTGDPFQGCVGALPEDALEQLGAIILLPESQAGELRVYEMALCGEGIETAATASAVGSPDPAGEDPFVAEPVDSIPVFVVDSDVTLDSVVQTANGAQELSTDIKFYPNTRRAKPGDTVYWTLDLGDLEGPFTIVLEMNNDDSRESSISTSNAKLVIEHSYDAQALYVPYVVVRDRSQNEIMIYSSNVLLVVSDLQYRESEGLDLPAPGDAFGDYIKAMNVLTFDYTLFGTLDGEAFIRGELDRIAATGCNMVIYNVAWFNNTESSSIHEPIYGNAWPACWVGTLSLESLIKFTDWTHERGMRVCLRYFLRQKEDHSGYARANYVPADPDLYIRTQTDIRVAYGELCEVLGIELFCLDSENTYFTNCPEVRSLVAAVRDVYGGLLTNGAWDALSNLNCPFAEDLDVLCWSDYYFFTHSGDEGISASKLSDLFLYHYSTDIAFLLDHFQKPGFVVETGSNIRELDSAAVEREYTAYLEAFEYLQTVGAPLCGNGWWVWNLNKTQVEPHAMRGHSAEGILANYWNHSLTDSYTAHFSFPSSTSPSVDSVLEDYEGGLPEYEVWRQGSSVESAIVRRDLLGNDCLRILLQPSEEPDYRLGFIWDTFTRPENWEVYSSFNFWLKSEGENWGLEVGFFDSDVDRFNIRIDNSIVRYLTN